MKFVNDKGLNTPERLYAIGEMLKANFKWDVTAYSAPAIGDVASYPLSDLTTEGQPVRDYSQVVAGQIVLWLVNKTENVYLCVIRDVNYINGTFRLSDAYLLKGSPGKNGINGTNGKDGNDGLPALQYKSTFNGTPETGKQYSFTKTVFSREPVVGDVFTFKAQNADASIILLCTAEITQVQTLTANATVTSITGNLKGAQGQPGESKQLYEHFITVKAGAGGNIVQLQFVNDVALPYTALSAVVTEIRNKGITGPFRTGKTMLASGSYGYGAGSPASLYNICAAYAQQDSNYLYVVVNNGTSSSVQSVSITSGEILDAVAVL